MLSVIYAECRYAVCRDAECRDAECRYAERRYAECRGTEISQCWWGFQLMFNHLVMGNQYGS
jgi:hypothetical protein